MSELIGVITIFALSAYFIRRNYDPKKAERQKYVDRVVRETNIALQKKREQDNAKN